MTSIDNAIKNPIRKTVTIVDGKQKIICTQIGSGIESHVIESPYSTEEVMKLERMFVGFFCLPFKCYDREQAYLKTKHLDIIFNKLAEFSDEYLLTPIDTIEMDGYIAGYTQERIETETTLTTLILEGNYMALPYYRQLLISIKTLIEHELYMTDYNTDNYIILGNQAKLIDFGFTYHSKEIKEIIGFKKTEDVFKEICYNRLIQMFYIIKSILFKYFQINFLDSKSRVNLTEIVQMCRYFNVSEDLITKIMSLKLDIDLLIEVLNQIMNNFPSEFKFEMTQIL